MPTIPHGNAPFGSASLVPRLRDKGKRDVKASRQFRERRETGRELQGRTGWSRVIVSLSYETAQAPRLRSG